MTRRLWLAAVAVCSSVLVALAAGFSCGVQVAERSVLPTWTTLARPAPLSQTTANTAGLSSSSTVSASTVPASGSSMSTGAPSTAGAKSEPTTADLTPLGPFGYGASVFVDIAGITAPMPIYGLTDLPEDWEVAANWWPVVSLSDPTRYLGPEIPNPRLSAGTAGLQEVQLVFRVDTGWLLALENFRGDLGDVAGNSIGNIDGHDARLYPVNGGFLVQWSDSGRWYGLFGRGLPSDEVVRTALSFARVSPRD